MASLAFARSNSYGLWQEFFSICIERVERAGHRVNAVNELSAIERENACKRLLSLAPGGPEVLRLKPSMPISATPEQVLVGVAGDPALNRARHTPAYWQLPPPPGESDISAGAGGEVEAIGAAGKRYCPGDRVFGLVG